MKVRFLTPWQGKRPGQTANLSDSLARWGIERNIVEPVRDKKQKKKKE